MWYIIPDDDHHSCMPFLCDICIDLVYFLLHILGWPWILSLSKECSKTNTELVSCLTLKRPGSFTFQSLRALRYHIKSSGYSGIETKQIKRVAWTAHSFSRHSHWGTFPVTLGILDISAQIKLPDKCTSWVTSANHVEQKWSLPKFQNHRLINGCYFSTKFWGDLYNSSR